jgi:hypothetical protein
MTDEEREYESAWHLDRKVPIALIITIAMQTIGIVWFAAGLFYRVDALEKQQLASQPHSDRITRMEVKVESIERGVTEIKSLIQQRPAASPLLQR